MAKKIQRGLGRGLGALLGDDVVAEAPQSAEAGQPQEPVDAVRMLPIGQIDPNRDQPRRSFDEEGLKELAASIEAVGVLQPIIVAPSGDRFTIIAGERRYRASRLAGLDEIPAIVRDWDSQKRLEAALIENLQRDDLNPLEEAEGVRRLMDETGLTQEKAAERLGKSRPAVANLLRLLTLANLTVQQGWSVRQLERICAQPVKEESRRPRAPKDAQISELEGMARELFGTRVRLDGTADSGRITLFYYNADDLQRIWDVIEMAREK